MKRIIRLNESEFKQLVRQMINEISIKKKFEIEQNKLKGMDERTFEKICSLDCTTTDNKAGKYCNWLLSKFDRNRINDNDYCKDIRVAIKRYHDGKNSNILDSQGISNNIYDYKTADEFLNAMDSIMDYDDNVTGADIKKLQELEGQYEIVGESANWYIVNPQTWEAERYFGSNTSWCTVANEGEFDRYTNDGELYITMPKDKSLYKERMQFHFESKQFCDVDNKCVRNPKVRIANTVGEGKDFEEICAMWEEVDDRFSEYKYTKFSDVPRLLANGVDIEEVFDEVEDFNDGYAQVKLNKKCNYIGTDGKLLSDTWFDLGSSFSNGHAEVFNNGKYNFIGKDGELLSDKWFDDAWNFHNGYAEVKLDSEWNFIDTEGKELSPQWFDNVGYFSEGYAEVVLNGKKYYIDTEGNLYDKDKNLLYTREQLAKHPLGESIKRINMVRLYI